MTRKILVSAGHNDGKDRGASGNGYVEAVEAVKLRNATAAALRAMVAPGFCAAPAIGNAAANRFGAASPFSIGTGFGAVPPGILGRPPFAPPPLGGNAGAGAGPLGFGVRAAPQSQPFSFANGLFTAAIADAANIEVLTDGEGDVNSVLKDAIALAKTANIAIEYHFNAAAAASATGIEVLSLVGKKALSQRVAAAVQRATGLGLRGSDSGWKSDSSGQHPRLGFCRAGGLVIEVCFISNKDDMAAYSRSLQSIATGVARVLFNER
jgi:N-acetylmuramoyl-L-alanine amidase